MLEVAWPDYFTENRWKTLVSFFLTCLALCFMNMADR